MALPDSRLTEADLRALAAVDESTLVEFKQQWYDITKKEGKAKLVKSILAMANSATRETPGRILMGIDDTGVVVGTSGGPSNQDSLSQALSEWMQPLPSYDLYRVSCGPHEIDVLEVPWSPFRPFSSRRDFGNELSHDVVYCRRQATIGTCSLHEVETMIRQKDKHLGPMIESGPVMMKLVSTRYMTLTVRLQNVIEEPVGGIYLTFDLAARGPTPRFARQTQCNDMRLGPGETREVEFRLRDVRFPGADVNLEHSSKLTDLWIDVVIHLRFARRDGGIGSDSMSVVLSDGLV